MLTTTEVGADTWRITPEVELRETYTNNVFLGTGPRSDDFITQVTPGIRIDGRSRRLTANLSYRPSALLYARHNEFNDVVNDLAAFARLEAVERFFFVEASSSITQNFISPFAPRPGDIAINTPNRVETRTHSLSPYLRGQLGGGHEYELRNRNTWTDTNNADLGDIHTRQWSGRLASPVRLFGWAIEFDDRVTRHEDFARQRDQEQRLYRGRLYFQPDAAWRFSASAGEEQNNFALGEEEKETIYGAAVAWRPGPRTKVDLEVEHRFFGPYRLARFDHRTRLSAWTLTYSRDTTNFQTEVLRLPPGNTAGLLDAIFAARIPDPSQRAAAVDQFVRATGTPAFLGSSLAFFTEQIYLREGVDAAFTLLGVRNSISFTAFYAENTKISADAVGALPDAFLLGEQFTQRGFGVRADHKLTPFTSIGASATRSYTRRDEPTRLDSLDENLTVTLNHTASPQTNVFAGVSITSFDSDGPAVDDRESKSVFVGLKHRF